MTSTSINIKDFRTEIPGGFNDDHSAWVFPVITTTTSHGKESQWQIRVSLAKLPVSDPPAFVTITDSHYDDLGALSGLYGWIKVDTGIAGNVSKRVPTIVTTGKNLGKKSATNVFTQALRDALGLHNTQAKKASACGANTNTSTDTSTTTVTPTLYPPMLAQVFSAVCKGKWPGSMFKGEFIAKTAWVQPKYNGVRGMFVWDQSTNTVIMYSRRKNIYPGFAYIKAELAPILKKYHTEGTLLYLDGELYKHGVALQDISGYARREDQPNDIKLDFMLYDCYIANKPETTYNERRAFLARIFNENTFTYTKPVPTEQCDSIECAELIYKDALAEGFEGAMVRLDAPYRVSYNEYYSAVLLKMKPTFDAELPIVSYGIATKGKAAGALMIMCAINDNVETTVPQFPVTPAMEIADRVALAKRMGEVESNGKTHFENHWLGKKIIVEYDELSKDNVPLRARTKMTIRTWD